MNEFREDPSIKKYLSIAKNKEFGLTLISAGTGRGKTTACVNYLKENYHRYSKILYVSPVHPLIVNEMYPRLMDEPDLRDHVVYLKSAFKNMTDNNEIFDIDVDAIKNKKIKEYINSLRSQCRYYNMVKKDPTVDLDAIERTIAMAKSELKAYVRKVKTTNVDNEIITNEEINELKKMFPEDIDPSRNIYLMTADKLEARLDSLETPYKISSKDFINKSTLVILDESDKDYDVFLKHCCEENNPLEDALAPIQTLEKNISIEDGHWDKCKFDDNEEKIMQRRQELSKLISEINDQFKILYNFRTEDPGEGESIEMFSSNGRDFMLNLDEGTRYSLDIDDEKKTTVLRKVPEGKENFNIFEFIYKVKSLIDRMWSFVIMIANTRLKEMHDLKQDATYEDCLNYAVHQAFNKLSNEAKPYVEHIMNISIQNDVLSKDDNSEIDRGKVWRDGFLNISLKDAVGSNHTYIHFSGMVSNTPENKIAWLARNANVLSLSATQQIGGAFLPNFDYIKRVIGSENYHEYSDEDFRASESSRTRNKNNINVSVIKSEWNNGEIISRYAGLLKERYSIEVAERILNAIDVYLSDLDLTTKETFQLNKNKKLFVLVMDFILNPKALTGLLILNSTYDIKKNDLFLDLLKCCSEASGVDDLADNIYCLNASNLKETVENSRLEEFKEKANNGKKVLIISNKEAVGQGLNLQPEKDINYFHQEYPTHIMPNINDQKNRLDRSEKNKAIYRVRFMGDRGELNKEEERKWIKTINIPNRVMISYNNRKSLKLAATYRLVQGWGRITRNSEKEENTFIIIDEKTCDLQEELKSAPYSKTEEVYRIIDTIDEWNRESHLRHDTDPLLLEFKKEVIEKNDKLNKEIQNILRIFACSGLPQELADKKNRYDLIRNTLVNGGMIIGSNRTSGIFDEMDQIQKMCYARNPKQVSEYWVHYRSDENKYFETVDDVSFRERTGEGWRKYSYVDNVLKYQQYKWDKKLDLFILVPVAINILQGALAEQKVAEIMHDYTGGAIKFGHLKLEDTEMLGDYIVDGYPNIFIDVKGFVDHGERDISDYAYEKLRKIKNKYPDGKLAVINCYTENDYRNSTYSNGDIIVVNGIWDGRKIIKGRIDNFIRWLKSKG
ncbi:MAG: hypothetical protein IJF87_04040 [Erysipelotrichaceae bacterium]|nr:hypothetical protein [Erysipelotrichaceae bacterium]